MIEADIRGKLGRDGSRAHDRAEDLLTSTVFGLLRYLPNEVGLHAVLKAAKPVLQLDRKAARLGEPSIFLEQLAPSFQFWPSLGRFGEPDLVIELRTQSAELVRAILIEVKLHSPKSGSAEEDEDFDEEYPDPDQLVKYWQFLGKQYPSFVSKDLIYLTSHSSPPFDELLSSLSRAPGMRLHWMSWRDVWRALSPCSALPAADIKRLLENRGFRPFCGFAAAPLSVPASGFWQDASWFSNLPTSWPSKGFWRQ